MKIRYVAEAVVFVGDGPDSAVYSAFYGRNLEAVIEQAENASITNEAYAIRSEERVNGIWMIRDYQA